MDMNSHFELKLTSSRAGYFNPDESIKLAAGLKEDARAEAQAKVDEMGANGTLIYVADIGTFAIGSVRATKAAVAVYTAYQAERGVKGFFRGMKWVAA